MTTKLQRAYLKLVKNKNARTNAAKQYIQIFTEHDGGYLFTSNEMEKAAKRAEKNLEDIYPVEFDEPKPEVVIKEVIVEVPAKGFFAKLFGC